jgi:hypothetical protein
MKKFFLLSLCSLFFVGVSMARIWRVNNNTGVVADFTTIQAAHDGAAAGDTIHLEPSVNSYGVLNMSKRLVIFGMGQFAENNPGIHWDTRLPYVGNINIYNGSNGSTLMVRTNGRIYLESVSDINLMRCAATTSGGAPGYVTGYLELNNSDNILATGCWFSYVNFRNNSNSFLLTNCIIGNCVYNDGGSDGIITNNVINAVDFYAGNANCGSLNNSVVGNNIFNRYGPPSTFFNCNVSNNLAPNTNLPDGNGNQRNVDMSTVFVNNAGGFVDNVYQLKPGSPAIGAGGGGVDCGAFGGTTPFRLAMNPPIPSINKLSLPATPSGSTMTLTFSTRSNN